MLLTDKIERKKFYILFGIVCLYVFPIILANVPYIDDLERTITGYGLDWQRGFRPLGWLITEIMSFGDPLLDQAPMLLLCGLILLAAGVTFWGRKYFNEYDYRISALLFASALLCPFMLENYSYHYESFFMLTSLAILYALFAIEDTSWKTALLTIVIIVSVLSIYQAQLCTFLCLAIMEGFYSLKKMGNFCPAVIILIKRLVEACIALLIYLFVLTPVFPTPSAYVQLHGGITPFTSPQFFELLTSHITLYMGLLQDFFMSFSLPLQLLGAAILASYMLLLCIDTAAATRQSKLMKGLSMLCIIMTPFLLILFSFLPLAFLENPVIFPRVMESFTVFWMLLFSGIPYLAARYTKYLYCLFVPFLLFCFAFSYSYGQTLKAEFDYENRITTLIATDFIRSSQPITAITFIGRVSPSHEYQIGEKKYPLFPHLLTIYMDNKRYWGSVMLNRHGVPLHYSALLSIEETEQIRSVAPAITNTIYEIYYLGNKAVVKFK